MTYDATDPAQRAALVALFTDTFTRSEGPEEGAALGALVTAMLEGPSAAELRVDTAQDAGALIGAVCFTPLRFDADPRRVMLLSPMAVATDRQGTGVGQALLSRALADLRAAGVDAVLTYGDPAFYGKVGFVQIGTDQAAAPFPLSQPEGWLGQSLTEAPLLPLKGASRCTAALDDAAYW